MKDEMRRLRHQEIKTGLWDGTLSAALTLCLGVGSVLLIEMPVALQQVEQLAS